MKLELYNTFDKQATEYEEAAKVQFEIGKRLFERLAYLKITPRNILDLGCGSGLFSLQLKKYYPKAQIISFDLASGMLHEVKKKQGFWRRWPLVQGDMNHLPFNSESIDLIFSNQVIHWTNEIPIVLKEINRVMSPHACLIFSTLGPDTFKELKMAWQNADNYSHTHEFKDMHEIGDLLLKEQMQDPVMDQEILTVHYSSLRQLVKSLKAQGVQNASIKRNKGLTTKQAWKKFESTYETFRINEKKYPLTYEVVYGHAWKGNFSDYKNGDSFFPISKLKSGLIAKKN